MFGQLFLFSHHYSSFNLFFKFKIIMISAIIEIILGVVVWKMVPGWITEGKKSVRESLKLVCNIIGIILVLAGGYSLIMSLI